MLIPSPTPILRFDDDGDRLMFHLLTHQRNEALGMDGLGRWKWLATFLSIFHLSLLSAIRIHRFKIDQRENGDLAFALHHVAPPPRSIVRPLHSMLLMLLLRFGFVLRCCIAMGQISAAAVAEAAANSDRSPDRPRLRLCTVVAMDEGAPTSIVRVPKSRAMT